MEVRQMRELIDLLVTMVVEGDDIDEEEPGAILTPGVDIPRMNT